MYKKNKLSKTDLTQLMKKNSEVQQTVTWRKNNGKIRTMVCTVDKNDFLDNLGYIKAMSYGDHKRINPRSLMRVDLNGKTYVRK